MTKPTSSRSAGPTTTTRRRPNVDRKAGAGSESSAGEARLSVRPRLEKSPPYPAEIEAIRLIPYGLRGFRRFCQLLVLEDGSRFKLATWELFVLGFYFAGILELVIILPKKNGKTTLLAALALYHLLMVASAEVVIGAASVKQANIMRRQADLMVRRSGLERRPIEDQDRRERTRYEGVFELRGGSWEIRFELGRIIVLAADADTADGVIPTLALVDELHRHPNGNLYGVFRDGLGPRNGQIITISTPGASADSPLGQLRDKALTYPEQANGKRRLYRSTDFALVEWGLVDGDDPNDLTLVKKANPAPWQTIGKLRQRRDSPSMTPSQWRRFGAGMWTQAEEAWIDPTDWDALALDIGGLESGEPVWLAVRDGAVAIVGLRGEGIVAEAVIGSDDFSDTEAVILKLTETYDVRECAYDATAFGRSADLLAAQGVPMLEVPYRDTRIMQASATLQRLVGSELLHHDGDPELRAHVLAGTTKQTERGWRLVMTPENRGLIALAFAAHQATNMPPEMPAFVAI